MAFTLDTVSPFEAAYVTVLMIVFVIFAFVCQRKTWMWVGMTAFFAFGVAYAAVPGHLLKFQVLS